MIVLEREALSMKCYMISSFSLMTGLVKSLQH